MIRDVEWHVIRTAKHWGPHWGLDPEGLCPVGQLALFRGASFHHVGEFWYPHLGWSTKVAQYALEDLAKACGFRKTWAFVDEMDRIGRHVLPHLQLGMISREMGW